MKEYPPNQLRQFERRFPKVSTEYLEDSRMTGAKCSTAERDDMFALFLFREKYTVEDRQSMLWAACQT